MGSDEGRLLCIGVALRGASGEEAADGATQSWLWWPKGMLAAEASDLQISEQSEL